MRFSDYLTALPAATQTALITDLTLGCGRVTLAARLLEAESPPNRVLGSLTAAYHDLHALHRKLGMAASSSRGAARWDVTGAHLPAGWQDQLAAQPPAVLSAWLAAAAARVHDLGTAVGADVELGVIHAMLSDLLRTLATLPDPARAARLNGRSPLRDGPGVGNGG